MAGLRFTDLQTRPTEVLDLTSLTVEEFQPLAPPFDTAFQAHMAQGRFDGHRRTARRYTTYQHCPRPTPEDRWLLILVYLKTDALPVGHGRRFGMDHSKAHQWIHLLLGVLRATLRTRGDAPSRSIQEWATRLAVAEADAAAVVVPPPQAPTTAPLPAAAPAPAPASPLVATTGLNDALSAPTIRLNRRAVIVARKSATR